MEDRSLKLRVNDDGKKIQDIQSRLLLKSCVILLFTPTATSEAQCIWRDSHMLLKICIMETFGIELVSCKTIFKMVR